MWKIWGCKPGCTGRQRFRPLQAAVPHRPGGAVLAASCRHLPGTAARGHYCLHQHMDEATF